MANTELMDTEDDNAVTGAVNAAVYFAKNCMTQ